MSDEDLKWIKFENIWSGWGWADVSPEGAKVKLKSDLLFLSKYYFFNGSNEDIVISKEGNEVILKANSTTLFSHSNGRFKSLGWKKQFIPYKCELLGNCTLNEEELKSIDFKGLKKGNYIVVPEECTVTLRVEKTTEEGYMDNRKYIFTHNCNRDLVDKFNRNQHPHLWQSAKLATLKKEKTIYSEEMGMNW